MRSLHWRLAAAAMTVGVLAACGDGNQSTVTPPVTPPPVVVPPPAPKLEDQFGTNFGIAYRADPNTDAKDPAPGDIVPLSLTTDPVAL